MKIRVLMLDGGRKMQTTEHSLKTNPVSRWLNLLQSDWFVTPHQHYTWDPHLEGHHTKELRLKIPAKSFWKITGILKYMFLTVLLNLLYLHYAAFCHGLFEAFDARVLFFFPNQIYIGPQYQLKKYCLISENTEQKSNLLGNERQRAFPFVFNQRSQRVRRWCAKR